MNVFLNAELLNLCLKGAYILSLLSEIQSPKGHLNLYITLVFCKTPIEGEELFLMTRFEVLNLL